VNSPNTFEKQSYSTHLSHSHLHRRRRQKA